jgi:hypothetical protein
MILRPARFCARVRRPFLPKTCIPSRRDGTPGGWPVSTNMLSLTGHAEMRCIASLHGGKRRWPAGRPGTIGTAGTVGTKGLKARRRKVSNSDNPVQAAGAARGTAPVLPPEPRSGSTPYGVERRDARPAPGCASGLYGVIHAGRLPASGFQPLAVLIRTKKIQIH